MADLVKWSLFGKSIRIGRKISTSLEHKIALMSQKCNSFFSI